MNPGFIRNKIIILIALLFVVGFKPKLKLKDFKSDGCSLFPDRSLISENDWCDCCLEHDIAYWRGGTKKERKEADSIFKNCIEEKTGNKFLAGTMHLGVRAGASPYFYAWYRWGFGWPYGRFYKKLSDDELSLAEEKLQNYFQSNPDPVCH